jgi:hypothetical protein
MGNVLQHEMGVDFGCNFIAANTNLDDMIWPFAPAIFLWYWTWRLTNYRCGEALSVDGWKRYCIFYKWDRYAM